jgi:hypothetical protein
MIPFMYVGGKLQQEHITCHLMRPMDGKLVVGAS